MAQNAQKLQAEREALSVDLADKSNTIKKLLEDNEILKAKLRQAQGEAQDLMRSMQKQPGENFSPSIRKGIY